LKKYISDEERKGKRKKEKKRERSFIKTILSKFSYKIMFFLNFSSFAYLIVLFMKVIYIIPTKRRMEIGEEFLFSYVNIKI